MRENGKNKDLISYAETGEYFGVNRSTIWTWIDKRGFPEPVRVGRNRYFDLQEVLDWEQRQAKAAKKEKKTTPVNQDNPNYGDIESISKMNNQPQEQTQPNQPPRQPAKRMRFKPM